MHNMFLLTNLFFIIRRSQASFLSKSFRKNNFESFHITSESLYNFVTCSHVTFCPTDMLEPKEKWIVLN